jgi:hypothetical protein
MALKQLLLIRRNAGFNTIAQKIQPKGNYSATCKLPGVLDVMTDGFKMAKRRQETFSIFSS